MGLLKFLLYAILPLFALGNVLRFGLKDNIFITPIDLGIIALLPFAVFYLAQHPKKVKANLLFKYTVVFLIALLASLFINVFTLDPKTIMVALLYFVRIFAYAQLIFLFSLLGKKFSEKYLRFMFWSISATAFVGLLQYFLYNDLRNLTYLGWDEHLYRVFSTFLDPNFSGVIFALGLAIGFTIYKKTSKNIQKATIISEIVLLVSLFLTYSRTAFVSFFAAMLAFAYKYFDKKYILALVSVIILGLFLLPKDLKSEGVDLTRTASIQARLTEIQEGLDIFKSKPILGIGFNAYQAYNTTQSQYPNNAVSGIPNSYIFTLATSGVVGFSALLYLFYGVYKLYKKTNTKLVKQLIFSASLVLATSAFFENTLYYNFIMFAYFSILGISFSLRESSAH